ncbi:hypothetical protein [Belliella pelovolcani]|uniref:Uncharacterized protein n=1 Tax=Belliella pelovolcani TaxID=529505 RepID=A0A1N7MET0_9BACT|nr:hypothetical protein [Belliella pelovolcani]SIS84499.1 hypothetical protein SAMN05421761_10618 [Belliella pelovolcani]
MKRKIIVSGIGPGKGGVGRLINNIIVKKSEQIDILFKPEKRSIKNLYYKKQYFNIIIEYLKRVRFFVLYFPKIWLLSKREVILLHPQALGYNLFFRIVKRNKVYFYVMDNGFFCVKSYNNNPNTGNECFKCIGSSANIDENCNPFPINYERNKNISYLKKLKEISPSLIFLAQNKLQKKVLENHFGEGIKCTIIGMDTGEFSNIVYEEKSFPVKYDIVFHGANLSAKGINYVIDLSLLLPQFSFAIPFSKNEVESYLGFNIYNENLKFIPCSWESGLKNMVISSRLVLNPSLWSAPIEGALLKSYLYNPNLATVKTDFGFEKEFSKLSNHLRLSEDLIIASKQIIEYLNQEKRDNKNEFMNRHQIISGVLSNFDRSLF